MRDRLFTYMMPVAALLMTAAGAVAQAQVDKESIPPEPALRGTLPVWLGYLVIFVLFAAVVMVSLMPSKRAHPPE